MCTVFTSPDASTASRSFYPQPLLCICVYQTKSHRKHFIKSQPTATRTKVFLGSSTRRNPGHCLTTWHFIVSTVMTQAWETTLLTAGFSVSPRSCESGDQDAQIRQLQGANSSYKGALGQLRDFWGEGWRDPPLRASSLVPFINHGDSFRTSS